MRITSDIFGNFNGTPIKQFTITNRAGNAISVMTLGATWTDFEVAGKPLLVHFNSLADYVKTPFYLGKSVGRVAGRIGSAKANIMGKELTFDANENGNTLHGGPNGFSFLIWEADQLVTDHAASVTFQRRIRATEDHFPGDLDAQITYSFDDDNQVTIKFDATATENTLFNPTNHAYFNLTDGQTNLDAQQLQINGDDRLVLDSVTKLPTGKFTKTAGTGYDFSTPTAISTALGKIKTENGHDEIDDAFRVHGPSKEPIAVLSDANSRRHVAIYSDRNALVVFTANVTEDGGPYNALAMEAQTLPDAVHHVGFGDITLPAGRSVSHEIRYRYFEE